MPHSPADQPEVVIAKRNGLGLITLNRPKALNALTHSMVRAIDPALRAWASDDTVRAVVLTGAGDRGLCAGGDIVAIYHSAKATGVDTSAVDFWRDEYHLNALIARYPKPYVALMDGIVMGGGVGLAAHGNTRIVTERSMIGMPEVGIGFVPDVGGTHLLAHAPGQLGTHVALTTARMSGADAIALGFADYYVAAERIPSLLEWLADEPAAEVVPGFSSVPPESELLVHRTWIDACYAANSVAEIVSALQASDEAAAQKAAEQILSKSPTALAVTLEALRRAAVTRSLEHNLNREFRVSVASLRSHDLVEGIRAQVIDKDRNPRWCPATLDEVTPTDVKRYFSDLGDEELGLTEQALP